MFEVMLNGEMDNHLRYETTDNRRNEYIEKTVRTNQGNIEIKSPRDRGGSFEPQVIPKRSRVLNELNDWQNRPLKKVYPFVFVDCMCVTIGRGYEVK